MQLLVPKTCSYDARRFKNDSLHYTDLTINEKWVCDSGDI